MLHIISSLEQGGAERQLLELVKANSSHAICQLFSGNFYEEEIKNNKIKLFDLNFKKNILTIFSILKLYKIIKNYNPEVINTWMYHSSILEIVLRKILFKNKIPLIWGLRCSNMDMSNYSILLKLVINLCKYFSSSPNIIINNSNAGLNFHRDIGFKGKNIVIHNGIDISKFSLNNTFRKDFRNKYNINSKTKVLLCVARVDPMKDHKSLLEAFAKIKIKFPSTILILAGFGTDRIKDKNGLITLGSHKNINYVYSACDIIISCSAFGEGFSNALAEGMASELIPIATDVGDSSHIVGDVGKIISPNSSKELYEAIRETLKLSEIIFKKKKKLAKKRIIENFPKHKMIDAYNKEYNKLLGSK